jgi:hypothetical protein
MMLVAQIPISRCPGGVEDKPQPRWTRIGPVAVDIFSLLPSQRLCDATKLPFLELQSVENSNVSYKFAAFCT